MDVITTWGCLPQPQLATNWTTNKKRSEAKISALGWIRRWGGGDMQEVVRKFNLSQEGCITWRRVFGLNCRWEEWPQCPTHVSVYNQGRQASNFWEKHHIEVDTCTDINMSDIIVLHCRLPQTQQQSESCDDIWAVSVVSLIVGAGWQDNAPPHTGGKRIQRNVSIVPQ